MTRLASAFAIEVFDRRQPNADRLSEFINIYLQNFGPEHRTKSNELVDFLVDTPPDRRIVYFGLTLKGKPCGFATFMLYPEGALAVIDHLVIAPTARGYGAFFAFCDLIAEYLGRSRMRFDHIAAEVMTDERHMSSTIKPLLLLRLMRLLGFKIAKIRYWAPDPAISKDPDRCKAILVLASQPERDELPASEFVRIVEVIYQVHYGRWYQRTMEPGAFAHYYSSVERHLEVISQAARAEGRVVLNGMKNLDLPFVVDPNAPADAPTLAYIALLLIPAAVGIAVALAQELWVTIFSALIVAVVIGIFAAHPRLRRTLLRILRLRE